MTKIITNTELYLLKSIEFQYVKEKKRLKSFMKNQQQKSSGLKTEQWPNLKNLSGGLNLSRGLNMVGST